MLKIQFVITGKIVMFIHLKYIYNINYIKINIYMEMFSKYILYVCTYYIYIINIHRTHTYIM